MSIQRNSSPCTRSEWGVRARWGLSGSRDWSGERRENVHGNHSSVGRAQSPSLGYLLLHGRKKNEDSEYPQWEQEELWKLQQSLCWGKAVGGQVFVWKDDSWLSIISPLMMSKFCVLLLVYLQLQAQWQANTRLLIKYGIVLGDYPWEGKNKSLWIGSS